MDLWTSLLQELLWPSAVAVVPVAVVAAAACRFLPLRPATRHGLWVVVLAWFAAPFIVPLQSGGTGLRFVAAAWDAGRRAASASWSAIGAAADSLRPSACESKSAAAGASCNAPRCAPSESARVECPVAPAVAPWNLAAPGQPCNPACDIKTGDITARDSLARDEARAPGATICESKNIPAAAHNSCVSAAENSRSKRTGAVFARASRDETLAASNESRTPTPPWTVGRAAAVASKWLASTTESAGPPSPFTIQLKRARDARGARDAGSPRGGAAIPRLALPSWFACDRPVFAAADLPPQCATWIARPWNLGAEHGGGANIGFQRTAPRDASPVDSPLPMVVCARPLSDKNVLPFALGETCAPGSGVAGVAPRRSTHGRRIATAPAAHGDAACESLVALAPVAPTGRAWLTGLAAARDALVGLPPLPGSVWAAGIACFVLLGGARALLFRRRLRQARPAPASVRRAVQRVAQRMNLRRVPDVRMVSGRVSPMIWWGGRLRLLLPSELWEQLDPVGREAVLCHELAHLRRGDHWVGRWELIIACLYWWHPLVWWIRRRLHEEAELSCDSWVTWLLPHGRREYAEALLAAQQFVEYRFEPSPGLGRGVISRRARPIARRITMVMTGNARPRYSFTGIGLTAALIAAGWGSSAVWACPPKHTAKAKAYENARLAWSQAADSARNAWDNVVQFVADSEPTPAPMAAAGCAAVAPTVTPGAAACAVTTVAACAAPAAPACIATAAPAVAMTAGSGVTVMAVGDPDDDDDEADDADDADQDDAPRPGSRGGQRDGAALDRRLQQLERQLQRLERSLDRAPRGPRAGSPTPDAPPAPPAPPSMGTPAPGVPGGGRFYKLDGAKLKSLGALMIRNDVPLRVRLRDDGIEVYGGEDEQAAFGRFVAVLLDSDKHSRKFQLPPEKLEALSRLMSRDDVQVHVQVGQDGITLTGTGYELGVAADIIGLINGQMLDAAGGRDARAPRAARPGQAARAGRAPRQPAPPIPPAPPAEVAPGVLVLPVPATPEATPAPRRAPRAHGHGDGAHNRGARDFDGAAWREYGQHMREQGQRMREQVRRQVEQQIRAQRDMQRAAQRGVEQYDRERARMEAQVQRMQAAAEAMAAKADELREKAREAEQRPEARDRARELKQKIEELRARQRELRDKAREFQEKARQATDAGRRAQSEATACEAKTESCEGAGAELSDAIGEACEHLATELPEALSNELEAASAALRDAHPPETLNRTLAQTHEQLERELHGALAQAMDAVRAAGDQAAAGLDSAQVRDALREASQQLRGDVQGQVRKALRDAAESLRKARIEVEQKGRTLDVEESDGDADDDDSDAAGPRDLGPLKEHVAELASVMEDSALPGAEAALESAAAALDGVAESMATLAMAGSHPDADVSQSDGDDAAPDDEPADADEADSHDEAPCDLDEPAEHSADCKAGHAAECDQGKAESKSCDDSNDDDSDDGDDSDDADLLP